MFCFFLVIFLNETLLHSVWHFPVTSLKQWQRLRSRDFSFEVFIGSSWYTSLLIADRCSFNLWPSMQSWLCGWSLNVTLVSYMGDVKLRTYGKSIMLYFFKVYHICLCSLSSTLIFVASDLILNCRLSSKITCSLNHCDGCTNYVCLKCLGLENCAPVQRGIIYCCWCWNTGLSFHWVNILYWFVTLLLWNTKHCHFACFTHWSF